MLTQKNYNLSVCKCFLINFKRFNIDYQQNTKENIVFKINSLVPAEVLMSIVLHYITRPLYLRAYMLSCNQQQVQQYMPKRYNNTIRKQFLRSKKTIKVTLSSITRIGLIIYIKDPKEASGVNHAHIEDTKAEETTIADITTTSHPIRSNTTSIINLDASQVSI